MTSTRAATFALGCMLSMTGDRIHVLEVDVAAIRTRSALAVAGLLLVGLKLLHGDARLARLWHNRAFSKSGK